MTTATIKRPIVQVPSFTSPTLHERMLLDEHLAPEREWYADAPRFSGNDEVEAAFRAGSLVNVSETIWYRPIDRFSINPITNKSYLSPGAACALNDWAEQTFENLIDQEIDVSGVRFAITSMVRSVEQQNMIIEEGKLAVPDSTHTAGGAFDVDMAGYYEYVDGELLRVSVPGRAPFHKQLIQTLIEKGVSEDNLPKFDYERYNPEVPRSAMDVVRIMQDQGLINGVLEFSDTINSCYHIAANPDYYPCVGVKR